MKTQIYTSGNTLPDRLAETNFFHGHQLFYLAQATPRLKPYLVTLETDGGEVAAQMLALVRYRSSLFPPYLYRHCLILGEGVYADGASDSGELFGIMLQAITSKLGRWTLYIEVSHLSQKMFGYRQLRDRGFFPVRWMSIHNSLHSRTPEERISSRMLERINTAYERGVVTAQVGGEEDFREFMRLLKHHNWLKPKRYIPDEQFFRGLMEQGNGQLSLTRYHDHVVGCSAVVYSHRQAYLWYAAYRRKSYAFIHPDILTIWHAIKDAHRQGCEHIYFMDVGLPYRKNTFRDFILRFGGKPVSTYRWFRCSIRWINCVLSWLYRD